MTDLLFLVGVVAIITGIALIFLPAAVITGGLFGVAGAVLAQRGK